VNRNRRSQQGAPEPFARQKTLEIPEIHHPNIASQVTCGLGLVAVQDDTPAPAVILQTPDEQVFAHVVNLLIVNQNGEQTFPRTAPSTYFGDNNIRVTFYHGNGPDVLVEVLCKRQAEWLTHSFVFRSRVEEEHFDVFKEFFGGVEFFYVVPGLGEDGDLKHVALTKYTFAEQRLSD
jgi:hypothetical protein